MSTNSPTNENSEEQQDATLDSQLQLDTSFCPSLGLGSESSTNPVQSPPSLRRSLESSAEQSVCKNVDEIEFLGGVIAQQNQPSPIEIRREQDSWGDAAESLNPPLSSIDEVVPLVETTSPPQKEEEVVTDAQHGESSKQSNGSCDDTVESSKSDGAVEEKSGSELETTQDESSQVDVSGDSEESWKRESVLVQSPPRLDEQENKEEGSTVVPTKDTTPDSSVEVIEKPAVVAPALEDVHESVGSEKDVAKDEAAAETQNPSQSPNEGPNDDVKVTGDTQEVLKKESAGDDNDGTVTEQAKGEATEEHESDTSTNDSSSPTAPNSVVTASNVSSSQVGGDAQESTSGGDQTKASVLDSKETSAALDDDRMEASGDNTKDRVVEDWPEDETPKTKDPFAESWPEDETSKTGTTPDASKGLKVDLYKAKKDVNASSHMFIEKLRGAAHRRKMEVTRSRDSLRAKEREHLQSIAEAKQRSLQKEEDAKEDATLEEQNDASAQYKAFKAIPVPTSVGNFGQVGIPKVEKRPPTEPCSPQLGSRRKESVRVRALESHGGQAGVPKVSKKPTTVPISPHLGPRRREQSKKVDLVSKFAQKSKAGSLERPVSRSEPRQTTIDYSFSSSGSGPLVGLDLLSRSGGSMRVDAQNCENTPPTNVTPTNSIRSGYVPRSTIRAKKRAQYDVHREQRQAERRKEEKCRRKSVIQKLKVDLTKLKESL